MSTTESTTTDWNEIKTPKSIAYKHQNILKTFHDGSRQRYISVVPCTSVVDNEERYLFTLFTADKPYTTPYRETTALNDTSDLTEDVLADLFTQ